MISASSGLSASVPLCSVSAMARCDARFHVGTIYFRVSTIHIFMPVQFTFMSVRFTIAHNVFHISSYYCTSVQSIPLEGQHHRRLFPGLRQRLLLRADAHADLVAPVKLIYAVQSRRGADQLSGIQQLQL